MQNQEKKLSLASMLLRLFFLLMSFFFILVFLRLPLTTNAMGICPSTDGGSIRCPSADGQGELQISAANAGAKTAKCTSTSQ